ncbi:MAG: hypothetical protein LUH04_09860, partial [Clostridium sp.]|nr:hypothetical protein [Clostridium sp.]
VEMPSPFQQIHQPTHQKYLSSKEAQSIKFHGSHLLVDYLQKNPYSFPMGASPADIGLHDTNN